MLRKIIYKNIILNYKKLLIRYKYYKNKILLKINIIRLY